MDTYHIILVRADGQRVEETQVTGFGAESIADSVCSRAKKETCLDPRDAKLDRIPRYIYGCVFVINEQNQLDHKRGEFFNAPAPMPSAIQSNGTREPVSDYERRAAS